MSNKIPLLLHSFIYFVLLEILGHRNKCHGQAQNLFLCTGVSTRFYGQLGGPCITEKLTNELKCPTAATICNAGEKEATCICEPGFAPYVLRLERMYQREGEMNGCALCVVEAGQKCRPGQMESVFIRAEDAALLTNETRYDYRIKVDEAVANNNKTTNITRIRALHHELVKQLKADKAKGMIGRSSADWSCLSGRCDDSGNCAKEGRNPHLTYFPAGYQDPATKAPPTAATMKSGGSYTTVTRTRKILAVYMTFDVLFYLLRISAHYLDMP